MFPIGDKNPASRFPIATILLIVANVAVFAYQATALEFQHLGVYAYGFVPANVFRPELTVIPNEILPPATVLTAMFLHADLIHLGSNMLFLWIFGDNIEDAMGALKFLVFYFLCGVAAAFGQAFVDLTSVIPMVGASGAVSGVLGAYLVLHPMAPIRFIIPPFFFIPLQVPAFIMLGFWFAFQLVSDLMTDPAIGGVAFRAHIAGFIAGAVFIAFFKDRHIPLFKGTSKSPWR